MMGTSHSCIGASSGLLALSMLGYPSEIESESVIIVAIAISAAIVGGLFPDIDEPNSTIWTLAGIGHKQSKRNFLQHISRKKKNVFTIVIALLQMLLGLLVKGFTTLLPHRGVTHYLLFGSVVTMLFAIVMYYLYPEGAVPITACFGFGYLSHCLSDACTKSGVKLIYPFSKSKIHLLPKHLRVATGSPAEWGLLIFIEVGLTAVTLLVYIVNGLL